MARNTFRKHERLTGTLRIRDVVTTGRSVHDKPFKLVGKRAALPGDVRFQVAFAVPKRNVRRAVLRNRIKRLMREAFRLNKAHFMSRLAGDGPGYAFLFIHQAAEAPTFEEARLKISRALDRWLHEHG